MLFCSLKPVFNNHTNTCFVKLNFFFIADFPLLQAE